MKTKKQLNKAIKKALKQNKLEVLPSLILVKLQMKNKKDK